MPLPFLRNVSLLFLVLVLAGCGLGYDRAVLVTKTNVGLDIDSTPPTAEITIARRELAIQPMFPQTDSDESALPLLASFGFSGNFFNPNISGHFAGGEAAVQLTNWPEEAENPEASGTKDNNHPGERDITNDPKTQPKKENRHTAKRNSSTDQNEKGTHICLKELPENSETWYTKIWELIVGEKSKKEPRPFFFATDTSYGVKVAWSGTTGATPDSLKLGYNRKEFASPPIFVGAKGSCPLKGEESSLNSKGKDNIKNPKEPHNSNNFNGYEIKIPSFYASIDNSSAFDSFHWNSPKHVQTFATGKAAIYIAKNQFIQQFVFNSIFPNAANLKAKQLGLNKDLIEEIKAAFDDANGTKKVNILKKAVDLGLVDSNHTDTNNFIEVLKKNHSNSPAPEISTKLIQVRRVAVKAEQN